MNVLIFASEFPPGPGGIGTHAFELAKGFTSRGMNVTVLAAQDYADPSEVRAFNERQSFAVRNPRSRPRGLGRLISLRQAVKESRADVLIASGTRFVWMTAAGGARGRPWLAIGHGAEFGERGRVHAFITRRAFSRAAAIVSVSSYTEQRMRRMGVSGPPMQVIHNGADGKAYHPLPPEEVRSWKEARGLSGRILLTVGNVTERKGQDIVVSALPQLVASGHDVHYVTVGLPTQADGLRSLASSLNVLDRLHVLGRLPEDELPIAYNACDVFVMTSRHASSGAFEGYGIAAVEAAMCARPSVVSRGSGLEEAIADGRTGLLVPENDPAATAEAIGSLLSNDSMRERFGAEARERALSDQTWGHALEKYLQVIGTIA